MTDSNNKFVKSMGFFIMGGIVSYGIYRGRRDHCKSRLKKEEKTFRCSEKNIHQVGDLISEKNKEKISIKDTSKQSSTKTDENNIEKNREYKPENIETIEYCSTEHKVPTLILATEFDEPNAQPHDKILQYLENIEKIDKNENLYENATNLMSREIDDDNPILIMARHNIL